MEGGFLFCLCPSPECRPSRYGPDCSLGCQCDPSSSYCNARNGQCRCLNGHMGPTCREGNIWAQQDLRWDSPNATYLISAQTTMKPVGSK